MPVHLVRWQLSPDHVGGTFVCGGDSRSRCHLVCEQHCGETWPCGPEEDPHWMLSTSECNVLLFLDDYCAEEVYVGEETEPRDGPVLVEWKDDYYVWWYAEPVPTTSL